MKYLVIFATLIFTATAFAQKPAQTAKEAGSPAGQGFATEIELAKKTLAAHGGDAFAKMTSLTVIGSVDVTTSAMNQAIPATFITIFAGDKYRLEINNPFQPIKQVYDGTQTSSTVRGFNLPPINRLGLPLLPNIGRQGFIVTALPTGKKKKGFRMTSPDGYHTDFYVDEKTGRVKGYDSSYTLRRRNVTTSVEIDKYAEVEGVVVPEKYAQRFDVEQMTVWAAFKAKEIKVNQKIADDVFAID